MALTVNSDLPLPASVVAPTLGMSCLLTPSHCGGGVRKVMMASSRFALDTDHWPLSS